MALVRIGYLLRYFFEADLPDCLLQLNLQTIERRKYML